MTTSIRVLIADDQSMVRQGFTVLLNAEPGIEVVGQAVDGEDAVAQVAELAPDVVLMDIRMPGLGGIEATRRLTEPVGATVKVLDEVRKAGIKKFSVETRTRPTGK